MQLTKLLLPAMLLLCILMVTACQTKSPTASSVIESADFVTRADACRALKPQQVSRQDTVETINAAVAADAAYRSFCQGVN